MIFFTKGYRYLKRRYFILKSSVFVVKYGIYNFFDKKSGINTEKREPKLIVSLTSYPRRFDSVFLTIESLLNQTLKPDKIILWLSQAEVEQQSLPANLTKLQSRGLDIRIVDENIKSYKKLIYTLPAFKDCVIVTCDDDMMYPQWFLQGLYQSYQKHPGAISAYRCRLMTTSGGQLTPYRKWPLVNNKQILIQPSYSLFPTGSGGTLYPPNTLHENVSDRIFLQLAPTGDDIWFKAMSLLNNTKTVMVTKKSIDFPCIRHSQEEVLWHENLYDNDAQIKNVFDHFKKQLKAQMSGFCDADSIIERKVFDKMKKCYKKGSTL